jgi:hypothetical protein
VDKSSRLWQGFFLANSNIMVIMMTGVEKLKMQFGFISVKSIDNKYINTNKYTVTLIISSLLTKFYRFLLLLFVCLPSRKIMVLFCWHTHTEYCFIIKSDRLPMDFDSKMLIEKIMMGSRGKTNFRE